jgi:enediyne biosynthesis protein E4
MFAGDSRFRAKNLDIVMRSSFALAAIVLLCGCGDAPKDRSATSSTNAPATNVAIVSDLFSNITAQSGVQFVHATGTNYFMPDQIGSGIAIFDFDQDGRLDLYFLQNVERTNLARNQLFQQQTNGTFKNVSAGSGLDLSGRGMSAIAGDINNDGAPDVVVTEYGATRVLQNVGGKFREVTISSGVDNPRWSVPASFLDFDRDGWLDLVVGNYIDYDPTQLCTDRQGRSEFCAPAAFPPTPTRLWRNITTKEKGAEPRFEDWTVRSGIHQQPGVALGIICADFTGDSWPDIFCADDGRPNRLFVNQHNGTFTEEALRRGLAYNAMGSTAANMGVALGDLTSDGLADLFVTHLSEEFHSFFQQDKPGLFTDIPWILITMARSISRL